MSYVPSTKWSVAYKHFQFSAGTIQIAIHTEKDGNLQTIELWLPNKFEIFAHHAFPQDFVFDNYLDIGTGATLGYQLPEKLVISKGITDDEFEQLLTLLVLELS
jgi:hypothetical protein